MHIDELTRALEAQGHQIVMVGPAVVESDQFGSDGGLVAWLKRFMPKFAYELLELTYSLVAYVKLHRAVKTHAPDCLYERYNLYTPAGVWIKRRFGLPMLLEVNAPLFDERRRYDGIALPRLARWSERYAWRGADHVLPVTEVLAERVLEAGVPRERISVIHNGIDLGRFGKIPDSVAAKRALRLEGRLVLGFTGFMREWHGLHRVVDVLAREEGGQPRQLLVVGDGPARESVERRARELGISDRVTITGVVGRDDVARYVAAFDVALQPDVVPYASPLKLFEYLALARAVVAPDTPNIREILSHEENALLFDPARPESFVDAVERLCVDNQLRERLSGEARETIFRGDYTWEGNARRVERLFRDLGVEGEILEPKPT